MLLRSSVCLLLLALLTVCESPKKSQENEKALPPMEVPPSYLSFRVNFAVTEMERGVNSVLPVTLMDGAMPMKDNPKDTLYLKIIRKGKLNLAVRKRVVYASIPLSVEASIKKKVLGMTLSNVDNPVTFSGMVKASADIRLNDNWDMEVNCKFLGFDFLGDSPQISIMGFTIGLESLIQKTMEEESQRLSATICEALGQAFDFRSTLEKVWLDIQNPQRIARNPEKIWLYSRPISLNGVIIPMDRDTLSVHLEYRTTVHITPELQQVTDKVPLGPRESPLNTEGALVTYPEVFIPHSFIDSLFLKEFSNQQFQYEGYTVGVTDLKSSTDGEWLKLVLKTVGDLPGRVVVKCKPAMVDQQMILEDFSYQLEAEDDLIKMTDWAVHQFVEEYVVNELKVDASPFFGRLDSLISAGIAKSRVGDKLGVDIAFSEISSHKIRLTEDGIQWIFYVEGTAGLQLKKDIFQKKPSR